MVGKKLDVLCRRESRGLAGRLEVEGEDAPGLGGVNRFGELGHQQMRNHRRKP